MATRATSSETTSETASDLTDADMLLSNMQNFNVTHSLCLQIWYLVPLANTNISIVLIFHVTGCYILVVCKAVMQLVGDEVLQLATEGNRRCLTLANMLLQLLLSENQREVCSVQESD